ncbi:ceroid-lipofuscinosis neuronal protein 6 homolog [Genypterus blacodes]|uniref:ceroid-lipofuscinosis neuronal protein 6 homolog n=1 Tax=Genypterus blacodes TaxID=154954 RepID=UPI003F758674
MSSRPAACTGEKPTLPKPRFHTHIWVCFTIQSWLLDVGRPVIMLLLPADWFPLNRPGAAEFLHLIYNISTPLLLLKLLERSSRTLPLLAVHLCIIAVVMGTSIHLVADSITQRLQLISFQLHLSVKDNPIMMDLKLVSLIDAFELLCYYDDTLGHFLWYVPLFLVLLFFFSGCFHHRKQEAVFPTAAWMLLAPSAAHYWYLITEGQTFILFVFTFFAMMATVMHQRRQGFVPDNNGLFLFYSFSAALVLVVLWVIGLWNDNVLRKKHPGVIYIPQPRVVFNLHHLQHRQT